MIVYSSKFDNYRSSIEKESRSVIHNPPWQGIYDVAQGRTMEKVMKIVSFVIRHRQSIGVIVGATLAICGYDFGNELAQYSVSGS